MTDTDHLFALRAAGYRVSVSHDGLRRWSISCCKGRVLNYWGVGSSERGVLKKAHDTLLVAPKIPRRQMDAETRRLGEQAQREAGRMLKAWGYKR